MMPVFNLCVHRLSKRITAFNTFLALHDVLIHFKR
jgi:hypothetical protein